MNFSPRSRYDEVGDDEVDITMLSVKERKHLWERGLFSGNTAKADSQTKRVSRMISPRLQLNDAFLLGSTHPVFAC